MRLALLLGLVLTVACSAQVGAGPASSGRVLRGVSPHPAANATGGVIEHAVPELAQLPADCGSPCKASLGSIAAGPDGNIWFVDTSRRLVGRVTSSGAITQFSVPATTGGAQTIAAGPDGNMWMTTNGGRGQTDLILRVGPNGDVTKFAAGSRPGGGFGTAPESITTGPDGNLWFTEFFTSRIGRMTPSGTLTEFATPTPDSAPRGIAPGPDGGLWFVESSRYHVAIARISVRGQITEYPLTREPSDLAPWDIAAGPDGNLWFTEQGGIGHVSPRGEVVQVPLPQGSQPTSLVAGPDGNIWFTDSGKNSIARMSVTGAIREFPLPRRHSNPVGIAAGADGRIWFTEADYPTVGSIGVRVPEVLLSQRVVLFADSSPKSLTITNTGDATLAIASARVTGVDKAVFTTTSDGCSGKPLAPGAACDIQLAHDAGGPPGVHSAFLEIADNATGTPQRVSLAAQLPTCKLPVVVAGGGANSPLQGSLLDLPSGQMLYEPSGGFESDPSGKPGIHTAAYPVLYGTASGYFDRPAGRWLPVSRAVEISPDGLRYAYSSFDPVSRSQVHVVDVATGHDLLLALPPDFWAPIAFTSRGIYLGKRYEGIGPGLWLLDPETGALQQILANEIVDTVSDSAVWLQARNPADTLPQPPTEGDARNQIVKRDLATGAVTTWLYRPGTSLAVAAVVNGSPVVVSYDGLSSEYLLVTSPNQAQRIELPFTNDLYASMTGFVSDPTGVWIGTADGVYVWSPRTGGVLISERAASPAGTCG